jgi:putative mycofactocin binding protein MftB
LTASAASIEMDPTQPIICDQIKTRKRYLLAPGTQVREEDFGLLFYSMSGPRLFFLPSGPWLSPKFFEGQAFLEQWLDQQDHPEALAAIHRTQLAAALIQLQSKGVIREC